MKRLPKESKAVLCMLLHWDASGNRHSDLAIMNKAFRSELIAAAREIGTLESANHCRKVKSQELTSITAWLANQSACWFCSFAVFSLLPLWQLHLRFRERKWFSFPPPLWISQRLRIMIQPTVLVKSQENGPEQQPESVNAANDEAYI